MNIQWGDKGIGWTDATWNPVTGCLSTASQCAVRDVCYARGRARRMAGRFGYPEYPGHFKPTFHPERLEEPYKLKKPAKIFVCSMGELFGPWVPREWQEAILNVVEENEHHTFQFLTKFPEGYRTWGWPKNVWLGTTINSNADKDRWWSLMGVELPTMIFISAEPLLGSLHDLFLHLDCFDWLIIGAQTRPNKQPERRWIDRLVEEADYCQAPIFMKSNLDYEPKRREFPHDS